MTFLYTQRTIGPNQMEITFPFPSKNTKFRTINELANFCDGELAHGNTDFKRSSALINMAISFNASLLSIHLTDVKNQACAIIEFACDEDCAAFDKFGFDLVMNTLYKGV